ncbi:glycoside hydrolase superfamily, partial [Blyttiomyces helicus]
VFAPYVDVTLTPDVASLAEQTGIMHFTLAFLVADASGRPNWGETYAATDPAVVAPIKALRALGGDVIVSFGGAAGTELAYSTANTDVKQITEQYLYVIDALNVSWVDFDIEGDAIADIPSVDMRNAALAAIKAAKPDLIVSYTLPVDPTGLLDEGVYVLQSASNAGLTVDVVNIMTMDYDETVYTQGATQMGTYAIQATR